MARLAFLVWLVLPSGLVLAAGARGGASGCLSHGSSSTASSSTATSVVPMLTIRPRIVTRHAFARTYFMPGYFAGGGFGFGNAMAGYNNGWPAGGYANSNPSNSGANIFAPGNAAQRSQPAANGNLAAPAAPADPPAVLPSRDWTILDDEKGDKTLQAQYAGMLDHKVLLRKADGHITLVALDQLSVADQDYVAEQTGHKSG